MKEIRLDRAHRTAKGRRDLAMRQLVIHAEDQRRALLPRQLRDRLPDACRALALEHVIGRGFSARIDMLPLPDRLGSRSLRADAIEADVDADSIQPGSQRRLAAKIPKSPERADEYILRQVAGVFVVADEAVAQLVHVAAVPLDDQVEGAGPA